MRVAIAGLVLESVSFLPLLTEVEDFRRSESVGDEVIARRWLASGPSLVVVTRGGNGVFATTPSLDLRREAVPIDLVDTVGAGDSFTYVADSAPTVSGLSPNIGPTSGGTEVTITGTGLEPRVARLRADRLGNGTGRIYTLTATATDVAGNETASTAACPAPAVLPGEHTAALDMHSTWRAICLTATFLILKSTRKYTLHPDLLRKWALTSCPRAITLDVATTERSSA